jgi:preprotein translocase subunit SecF
MPRDRRRGRRPHHHHAASRPGPIGPQPGQSALSSRQVAIDRTPLLAKAPMVVKQPVLVNPHLGRDLRNIGIVAVALVVLLIILSIVL